MRTLLISRPWLRFLLGLTIAYLLVVIGLMFIETSLVYPVPPQSRARQPITVPDCESIDFKSADGTSLHGYYFPLADAAHSILYCHGNGECVADNGEYMDFLRKKLGANVFVFDYRGYGLSGGTPHEAGILQDGFAAQEWLARRCDLSPEQLVLIGRSLGGGVAVALAERQGAKALVLENTFTRMTDAAACHFPWLPVRLVMRNRYPSIERIQGYHGPLFISHGTLDEVIPFTQGEQLFAAAPSQVKEFYEIPRGRHNDPQPKEYYEKLKEFLAKASE